MLNFSLLFLFTWFVYVWFTSVEGHRDAQEEYLEKDDFSFGNRGIDGEMNHHDADKVGNGKPKTMPPTSVMTRLILIMVWRKLIRNPNTYSSLIGLTWSLVSFRHVFSLIPLPCICWLHISVSTIHSCFWGK